MGCSGAALSYNVTVRPLHRLGFCLAASLAATGVITACVGDDPVTSADGDAAAAPGSDGAAADDGSSARDGSSTDASVDASADVDLDATKPPFDVRTLPGLRLWLESQHDLTKAAVGNDFVSWRDSSGHWDAGGAGAPDGGRHTAFPVPFNGGGAVYPGIVLNGIGGLPSVTFESGPKMAIANHADFDVGTGNFVIAVVAAVTSGTGPFWNLTTASTAPSGTWLGPTKSCSFLGAQGAPPKCTSPDYAPNTSPHLFIARRKLTQAIYRVDGTSRGTYDFGVDNPNLGVQTFQQMNAFIGGAIVAQLSELLFIAGTTTDSDLDVLEAHLKTKYAIP